MEVNALRLHDHVKRPEPGLDIVRYPPIVGNLQDRCQEALTHIAQVGLIRFMSRHEQLLYEFVYTVLTDHIF